MTCWLLTDWQRCAPPDISYRSCPSGVHLRQASVPTGDTSNNVWWRIKNGELPKNHMPKVVVLMVGANDLTAAYAQCGTWDSNDYYGAAATIAQQ